MTDTDDRHLSYHREDLKLDLFVTGVDDHIWGLLTAAVQQTLHDDDQPSTATYDNKRP